MVPIPERFAIRRTLCAATTALPVLAYALVCLPAAAQTLTQSAAQSTNSSTLPGSTFNGGLGIGVPQNTALGGGLVNLRDLVDSPVLQGQERQFQWNASIAAYAGYPTMSVRAVAGMRKAIRLPAPRNTSRLPSA